MIRSYHELSRLATFEERFHYLKLKGRVGRSTFGFDRHLNQSFYSSREWKNVRNHVIARDFGCDLGIEGYEIHDRVYIHHMNPMSIESIVHADEENMFDLDNLITTTHRTHNAIHYGDESLLARPLAERKPGDTRVW